MQFGYAARFETNAIEFSLASGPCVILGCARLLKRPVRIEMKANGNHGANTDAGFEAARADMVARQIRGREIRSERVLAAMAAVERHLFVPPSEIPGAYSDAPLPIGSGQTISQPFMVAAMSEALALEGHERVLEIGAGSGYQAAIVSL